MLSRLDAACCSVLVISGGRGFDLVRLVSTEATR